MNNLHVVEFEPGFEPERYELHAAPAYNFELPRRDFFKWIGSGVVILFIIEEALAQETGGSKRGGGQRGPSDIGAYLHIGEDGMITVYTGKVEVGQNIRTSLTQVVAEELRVPVDRIRMVMADTDLTPYDGGTVGSQTTPAMASRLRRVAAAARETLIDLAAEQLKVDRASLATANGRVIQPDTDKVLTFGQLTKGQKLAKAVNDNVTTTPPAQWKVAGQSVPKVGGRSYVTGRHKYASDIHLPGIVFGKVLRPVSYGATLVSLDSKEAEAIPGVTVVRDGNFAGVTAPDEQIAARALSLLRAEWKTTPQVSGSELYTELKKPSSGGGGKGGGRGSGGGGQAADAGSIAEGLATADHKVEQTYNIAYIAHCPLEPRAAVAQWLDERLTVWTGTQRPFGVRGELAQAFKVTEDKVRVMTPDTGAGYGGKHTGEAALEAARLARGAGKPVKLIWEREEEFTWAYFRPAGVIDVAAGVRKDGTITAWDFHNYNSGGSGVRALYDIPRQRSESHSGRSPLRQGSYRALASTANHFARESHMDDLARAVKMDPLEFRLKNLKDARLRAVLQAAATAFGWGKTKPAPNHGFGIAGGFEKGSYLANCAEVAVDRATGAVKVVRVVAAFECGAILNPDNLKNQIEGSIMMGIGGALFEEIKFDNGKILNPRFSRYRVPRFSDTPKIEVVLVDRKDLPSTGAGETPIVCIAPAIGNAIFNAVGTRLRSLPMAPKGAKV